MRTTKHRIAALTALALAAALGGVRPAAADHSLFNSAVSVADTHRAERLGTITFGVRLDHHSTSQTIGVWYTTQNGSAVAGTHYVAQSGWLWFTSGQTLRTVTVSIMDDAVDEPNRTMYVQVSNPVGPAYIADGTGAGLILDDDPAKLTVLDSQTAERDGGLGVPIVLSRPLRTSVTVQYGPMDATATAPGDYDALAGSVTFAPGETMRHAIVWINEDAVKESTEYLWLKILSANASVADGFGKVTIHDNDVY